MNKRDIIGFIEIKDELLEKIDCEKCFKNLVNLFEGETIDLEEIHRLKAGGHGIDVYDLALVELFAKKHNYKNVVEFGCGFSTCFMRNIGLNVTSFSMGSECGSVKTFVKLDLMKDISRTIDYVKKCDFLFIDSNHDYKMAENYFTNVLSKVKKPFVVHDFIHPSKPENPFGGRIWGEAYYLVENVIDNGYELFTFFCLPNKMLEEREIPESLNGLLEHQKECKGSRKPIACCAVFLPI